MATRLGLMAFLLLGLVIFPARSSNSQQESAPASRFLDPAGDWVSHCAPPPASESEQFRQEAAVMLWLQRTRNSMSIDQAWQYSNVGISSFQDPVGYPIEQVHCVDLAIAFEDVLREATSILHKVKSHFQRIRPYQQIRELDPALPQPSSSGYPSGHAMRGMLAGMLLAELIPERSDDIMARAELIGDLRVVVGLHYPSDVIEGRRLGRLIADKVIESEQWKELVREQAATIEFIRRMSRQTHGEAPPAAGGKQPG